MARKSQKAASPALPKTDATLEDFTRTYFTQLGATVHKKIYPNMGHTIIQDEIDQAQKIVNNLLTAS